LGRTGIKSYSPRLKLTARAVLHAGRAGKKWKYDKAEIKI